MLRAPAGRTVNGPELIAHRGYALHYPENTISALEAAVAAGAGRVEVDVQLSADGVPYLFHDRILDRVCGVEGRLSETVSAEVDRLSAFEPWRFGELYEGEPVARLDAFAGFLGRHPAVRAYVEVKRAAVEAFGPLFVLERVLVAIEPAAARCTLISFDVPILAEARRRGGIALGPVLSSWEQRDAPEVLALAADAVFCDIDKLPADGLLHQPSGALAVYEVDEPQVALELFRRGAGLIETFAIGEMLEALRPR